MADQIISYKVPSLKVDKALQGFLRLYPNNETKPDPKWVDPKDGTEAPQVAKYTDAQWFKEKVKRLIARDINRGLQMIAKEQTEFSVDDEVLE